MARTSTFSRLTIAGVALLTGAGLFAGSQSAQAATTLDGPVDLGTAATYGALAASALTNTGPTVVDGDIGISPGSSVTGFSAAPNGTYTGALHQTDAEAAQAQSDLTTAYNVAAGLSPTTSGLSQLNGLSLVPGVYSGGALNLADNGAITLAGSAQSVWVFQAASTLTIGSGTIINITGGASACNVFWQVGTSATLGTGAQFQGTVMADQSITATTGATVVGRLLASTAAVTLDTNTITVPSGCPAPAAPTTSPEFTSGAPTGATAGTPYEFVVTATGTPAPSYAVTTGALPAGLTLNGTTGTISGTPTAPGTSTFTITASNGTAPDSTATYTLVTAAAPAPGGPGAGPGGPGAGPGGPGTGPGAGPGSGPNAAGVNGIELADSGSDQLLPATLAFLILSAGTLLLVAQRRRRATR